MEEIICKNLNETKELAFKIVETIKPPFVITLRGDLGAGKTAFTKFLAQALNIDSIVTSPTFTLMNEYDEGKFNLYHFDMYRIENYEEVEELGFADYFLDNNAVIVVEWPDVIDKLLPKVGLNIIIEKIDDNSRKFKIEKRN